MSENLISKVDQLPCRESHEYAREKLSYIGKYQSIFSTGMKFHWPHRVYLDMMSGPGRCIIAETGEEFEGSPLLAAKVEFTERIFVERDQELAAALQQRISGAGRVIVDDCTAPHVIKEMRAACSRHPKTLGLAFIDNLGLTVPFGAIRDLSDGLKIDLMIVFQVQDLTRNVTAAFEGHPDHAPRFDAFFGTPTWRDVVSDVRSANASPSEITSALTGFYGQLLESIGYLHIAGARRAMKNSQNAEQYRLILAGKHERAVEFFRKIEAIDPRGQRALF